MPLVPGRAALAILALVLLAVAAPAAHEIPNEVTVQTFLKPDGQRLILLVRAPLKAMREMKVPERADGMVDFTRLDEVLQTSAVTWLAPWVTIYEEGRQLEFPELIAVRASLPSDRSFESYDQAFQHTLHAPRLDAETDMYWEVGLIDAAFVFPIQSDQSRFSVKSGLTRLGMRVNVVMRFLPPGRDERIFDLHGDPGIVALDPRWHQAAFRFVKDGFFHILDGIDHLLFLFCLVIPFRRLRPLLVIVTAFTVAHSITLIASAFNMAPGALWFPPLIETLIAMSIVYMGLENIVSPKLQRRWLITFAFGLVHGFGFSFALRESLQFAGSHLLTSLIAFNVGVEIGQLLVLLLILPLLHIVFRYVVAERLGTIIMSALIVHTAWHWMIDRGSTLGEYQYALPVLDFATLAAIVRWLIVLVIAAAAMWLMSGLLRSAREREAQ